MFVEQPAGFTSAAPISIATTCLIVQFVLRSYEFEETKAASDTAA
jgi:hypothetical protein